MKKISRRKFISTTAQTAAGLGIAAGCTERTIVGDDIRPPSAPTGLSVFVKFEVDGSKMALLSWNEHDLTDITGAYSEIKIRGYNVYRHDKMEKINDKLVTDTNSTDPSDLEEGATYSYSITAVDHNYNESPRSSSKLALVKKPSKIYSTTDPGVASGIKINADLAKTMVHNVVMAMTGEATIAKAFESLLPDLTVEKTIAIKINCLAKGGLCTHPELVAAVIDGLSQTIGGTFPLDNITVFDDRMPSHLTAAGFTLKNEQGDYKVITLYGDNNAWGAPATVHNSSQRFAKIVEKVDYIINVPVLKNHSSAGITFALKNFFGIIDAPGDMHDDPADPKATWCDPYVAEVYKKVADKVKLIIGDAIFGAYKNGPSTPPNFALYTVLAGTDPVAVDMYAFDLINTERQNKGLGAIALEPEPVNTGPVDARHIITAASQEYNLGIFNYEIIEV